MAGFIAEMKELASEMFTEFEAIDVTVTRRGAATVSAAGQPTRAAATTTTAKAFILPASAGGLGAWDGRLEDGTLAGKQLRYVKMLADGMAFEPKSLDRIAFAGGTWEVIGCDVVSPTGSPIVYGAGVQRI